LNLRPKDGGGCRPAADQLPLELFGGLERHRFAALAKGFHQPCEPFHQLCEIISPTLGNWETKNSYRNPPVEGFANPVFRQI
jgi:hypothetical protein